MVAIPAAVSAHPVFAGYPLLLGYVANNNAAIPLPFQPGLLAMVEALLDHIVAHPLSSLADRDAALEFRTQVYLAAQAVQGEGGMAAVAAALEALNANLGAINANFNQRLTNIDQRLTDIEAKIDIQSLRMINAANNTQDLPFYPIVNPNVPLPPHIPQQFASAAQLDRLSRATLSQYADYVDRFLRPVHAPPIAGANHPARTKEQLVRAVRVLLGLPPSIPRRRKSAESRCPCLATP